MRTHRPQNGVKIAHITFIKRIADRPYPIVGYKGKPGTGHIIMYEAQCDCGNFIEVPYHEVTRGNKTCCAKKGCPYKKQYVRPPSKNLNKFVKNHTGEVHGHLTLIKREPNDTYMVKKPDGKLVRYIRQNYLTRCKCGRETVKPYSSFIKKEAKTRKYPFNCGRQLDCPFSVYWAKKLKEEKKDE